MTLWDKYERLQKFADSLTPEIRKAFYDAWIPMRDMSVGNYETKFATAEPGEVTVLRRVKMTDGGAYRADNSQYRGQGSPLYDAEYETADRVYYLEFRAKDRVAAREWLKRCFPTRKVCR